jgi:hypothetical protein
VHAEGREDPPLEVRVHRLAGGGLDDRAEHDHAEVGVLDGPSGSAPQRRPERLPPCRLRGPLAPEGRSSGQAAPVLQQVAHGDRLLAGARERGDVAPHGRVEREASVVEERHHRARRADHLGQRGDVVERRVRRHRAAVGPRQGAVAPLPDGAAAAAHDQRRPRKAALGDAASDDPVEHRQPVGGHADRSGRGGGTRPASSAEENADAGREPKGAGSAGAVLAVHAPRPAAVRTTRATAPAAASRARAVPERPPGRTTRAWGMDGFDGGGAGARADDTGRRVSRLCCPSSYPRSICLCAASHFRARLRWSPARARVSAPDGRRGRRDAVERVAGG